ncbi:PTS glucose transporter subunit IIA [Lacticaseibacillus rhamnosus]|nr:PTS glucose transporter subunit IIA [Lacticaseibacillus rhamnosus]WHM91084.1 PTS glucose transporter subunit IIA [Lacticaseibacillus rhamnosus]
METQLYAPVDGELTDLTVVHDDVFSKKMIGNGFAVKPSSNEIFAGVNGEISSIFPTKHAIGIMSESHAEILLHLGIDTVELKGEPFEITAHVGDVVTPETLVAKMNIEGVTASGKDPTVLMVVTNSSQFEDEDDPIKKRSVQHGDKVFTLKPK